VNVKNLTDVAGIRPKPRCMRRSRMSSLSAELTMKRNWHQQQIMIKSASLTHITH